MFKIVPLRTDQRVATAGRPARFIEHVLTESMSSTPAHRHPFECDVDPHREPAHTFHPDDKHARLEVELPGVAKENVSVVLQSGRIVITANRFDAVKKAGENNDQVENGKNEQQDGKVEHAKHGQVKKPKPSVIYALKMRVEKNWDAKNISASMEGNGILQIGIPIKQNDGKRAIHVQ